MIFRIEKINKKISWELAPDPEAYQIFTRNYEKHEDGSENIKRFFREYRRFGAQK